MTMLSAIATADRSTAQPRPVGTPDGGATPASEFAALLKDVSAPAALSGIQAAVPMTMAETAPTQDALGAAAAAPTVASLQRLSQERLFSFSELGMFGRNGAQSGPVPEQVEALEVAGAADTVEGAISPVGQSPVLQQNAPQPAALRPGEQKGGPAQSMRAALVPLLARSELLAAAQITPEPSVNAQRGNNGESFSLGGSGTVARTNLSAQLSPRANPVSMLVSGSDEALSIVARAGGADPAQMRRLIESTAAEFDVNVAEFHFNGSTTELSFPSAIGGNHGNRSR